MSKVKYKTLVTVYNEQDEPVGMKLIDKPLNELVKEMFDMDCEVTDTIDLKPKKGD